MLAPRFNELPRSNHATCVFFDTSSCDPTWGMLWIQLDERVEEHACPFDISDFGFCFVADAIEVGEVPFGVDGGRGA